jgi:hypothetical protein
MICDSWTIYIDGIPFDLIGEERVKFIVSFFIRQPNLQILDVT